MPQLKVMFYRSFEKPCLGLEVRTASKHPGGGEGWGRESHYRYEDGSTLTDDFFSFDMRGFLKAYISRNMFSKRQISMLTGI